MDDDIYNKFKFEILYEENKINEMLKFIKFDIPTYNFENYINAKFNISNNISTYESNKTRNNVELDEEYLNIYDNYNNLKEDNIIKNLKLEYEKNKIIFKKNCLVINTFIYKGYLYGDYTKPSLLKIYINIELIKNLRVGVKEKLIVKDALEKYLKDKKLHNKIFEKIKILHDEFYNKVVKLKTEYNLKIFALNILSKYRENKKRFPTKEVILNEWHKLLNIDKNKYYFDDKYKYNYEDYQYLLDLYEFIHLVKPVKINHYYLVYLYKNYNKIIIKNYKDLINLYNNQILKEKEYIELFCYRQLLGYKFKNYNYNSKKYLDIFFKPKNTFNVFEYYNKNILNDNNKFDNKFLSVKFNNLNKKEKNKYIFKYNNINQNIKKIKNLLYKYIFDIPYKNINIFNYYINDKLKNINKDFLFDKCEMLK